MADEGVAHFGSWNVLWAVSESDEIQIRWVRNPQSSSCRLKAAGRNRTCCLFWGMTRHDETETP
jgi:hypothetical protein